MANPDNLTLSSMVKRVDDLLSTQLDGETVLMSLQNGKYYGMKRVGSRIWQLLEAPRRVAQICDTLMSEFNVDRQTCEADVLEFVTDLYREKIVEIVDAALE